jgi:microcystin-dependent protein
MANYVKATNFTAKDGLPTGNSGKIVKGAEIDTELSAVANAIASKADINSPNLTGTPTAPTANLGSNTTQLATTAFVAAGLSALIPSGVITLWSGAVSAIPSGWVLCNGSNSTPDLRDRFVVGAGSTYAVGATGGANTVTLDTTMIPAHTHSVTASGTSGNASTDHTHALTASGTTSGADINHTHDGITGIQSANHVHSYSGVTGVMNANALHSHTITDPGHLHVQNGQTLAGVGTGVAGGTASQTQDLSTQTATTGISVNTANIEHTHSYSGDTGGVSANHNHTFTTGLMNSTNNPHTHTVTVTGTSGGQSATHNHSLSVSGTAASTGGGLAHENRPPYLALAYIMKT